MAGCRYLIGFLLISISFLTGQEQRLSLTHPGSKQVLTAGFTLKSERDLRLDAIGAGGDEWIRRIHNYQEDKYNLFAYAWILDSKTRKMVWRMTIDNTQKDWWQDNNREFKDVVRLPAGEYEVKFAAVQPLYFQGENGFSTLGKLFDKLAGDEKHWQEQSREWKLMIEPVDEIVNETSVKKFQKLQKEKAIVDLTEQTDNAFSRKSFSIKKPARLNIYAIGEGYQGQMYDYGWIINNDTGSKIWEMLEKESEDAGGAIKNRLFRKTLDFPAGSYTVFFKTDDNHSASGWNANPPYDPDYWGIFITPAEATFDISLVDRADQSQLKPLINLTRIGDYAYEQEGLVLEKKSRVRIYALGEGHSGEMFDYGWITDAKTGKLVWKMKYNETKHAGGASKNRMYDEIITLDAGKYLVHYQSDDSHSFEDWNSPKPYEPDKWGISVYVLEADANPKKTDAQSLEQKNIIAELIRVGDDEHLVKLFSLGSTTTLRIYAIGEGDWDDMYDYGWIENTETNQTVWKMRYRETDHAGGADKNRSINTTITLKAGTYKVHYKSDDSHSYHDWNSKAPSDAGHYGITIYRSED